MAVVILCRRVEEPTERDWKSVKRVMCYLAATITQNLRFSASGDMRLECYVDVEWAGDKMDRKSISGYVFKLGNSVIAWSSTKQSIVALSSTVAEYVAASHAWRQLIWLRELLAGVDILQQSPTVFYEDNQSCIRLVESESCSARTKHIDVRHHHLRDTREQRILEMRSCPTDDIIADVLTKPLGKERFWKLIKQLGIKGEANEGDM
uniref:Reverse transcriptase Ty1/copia-type domain-containing protein n=1 Tax=Trichuris muris TaxID=70415 RepID=A0A5S6QGI8_TRIMR